MDQRGPMPPGLRGFVTFMAVAFVMTLALSFLQRVHPISHHAWMLSFYTAGAFAAIAGIAVYRMPS
ncbi:MAG TPA: hypothetical protein VHV51_09975 [Polyangiaceae bacterium]|jgi:hypothetical protein|nr:hypothetical protein [Polyangiaceae bacterium]